MTIVEPGPHRTRLLSERSVRSSAPIGDYADTVGQVREQLEELEAWAELSASTDFPPR